MDYKYIEQLLESYWQGNTSLEEENILRTFFSQKNLPTQMRRYKDLFVYEQLDNQANTLGDDFDDKVLTMIDEPNVVKAKVITMPQRLMPLFKAAAVVAIILTLGNAVQMPYRDKSDGYTNTTEYDKVSHGASVAMGDSVITDTLRQNNTRDAVQPATAILK